MSQVNVNPGPGAPRDDGGAAVAAAGINLVAVVLVIAAIVVAVVLLYGAFAGGWFGPMGGGNTNITVQSPSVTVQSPAAAPSR